MEISKGREPAGTLRRSDVRFGLGSPIGCSKPAVRNRPLRVEAPDASDPEVSRDPSAFLKQSLAVARPASSLAPRAHSGMRLIALKQASAQRQKTQVVGRFMQLLAFTLLGVLAGLTPSEARQEAEDLAVTILTQIRQSLPASASRSVDGESERVRTFANMVTKLSFYPTELETLQAAAIAAIDAANNPAATSDSLVRAAIAGVSTSLVSRSRSECGRCQDVLHESSLPTSVEAGTMRVISVPSLNLPEARGARPCSEFDHYFDFPTEGVIGVILDLRGNQGGYLTTAICVAGQFLTPKTPFLRVADRSREETLESPAVGRRPPIALPLVVFVDEDTESGALALAAAFQDAHRARLIGESKEHANAAILSLMTTYKYKEQFLLPIGEIRRINGVSLAAGIQVDVAVPAQDDNALLEAARALFGGNSQP